MSMDEDTRVRLEQQYEFTVSNLTELFAKADDAERSEQDREEAEREALDCVYGSNKREVTRLILGGGGPSTWLDVTVQDKEISAVEWGGAWWSEPITHRIENDSPLWRLAEYHVQGWE
jgi:hypothetical protein